MMIDATTGQAVTLPEILDAIAQAAADWIDANERAGHAAVEAAEAAGDLGALDWDGVEPLEMSEAEQAALVAEAGRKIARLDARYHAINAEATAAHSRLRGWCGTLEHYRVAGRFPACPAGASPIEGLAIALADRARRDAAEAIAPR